MNFARSIATAAVTLIASTGLVTLTAGPAAADTPGCVTRAEFRQVHDGMTKGLVHRIFDTAGHRESIGSGGESREYRTCAGNSYSYASVDYERRNGAWRVWFKWIYISY